MGGLVLLGLVVAGVAALAVYLLPASQRAKLPSIARLATTSLLVTFAIIAFSRGGILIGIAYAVLAWAAYSNLLGRLRNLAARPNQPMSRIEALDVLGLKDGANEGEVRAAHRELIQKLHPDRGGSNYLAAKLNQARDVLISRTS